MSVKRAIVSAIIRNYENKYLILKRSSSLRLAPGIWEFLSGTPENGETSERAILREVQEEIAVQCSIQERLPVFEISDTEGHWIVTPYVVAITSENISISEEHSEYRWVSLEEILSDTKLSKDLSFFNAILPPRR